MCGWFLDGQRLHLIRCSVRDISGTGWGSFSGLAGANFQDWLAFSGLAHVHFRDWLALSIGTGWGSLLAGAGWRSFSALAGAHFRDWLALALIVILLGAGSH